MDLSLNLLDILNPTEVFLMSFTLVIDIILIFLSYRKRKELINGLKPYFKRQIPAVTMIKMLKKFQTIQKGYKKSLFRQLIIFYGVHLIFYFMFLFRYYRLGSILTGLLILGAAFGISQIIYKQKVN